MIELGSQPHRTLQITQKISREQTGLNGSVFVHVDLAPRGNRYEIMRIALSEKSKDGSTLDVVLGHVSETLTAIIREYCTGTLEEIGGTKP